MDCGTLQGRRVSGFVRLLCKHNLPSENGLKGPSSRNPDNTYMGLRKNESMLQRILVEMF